MITKKVQLPVKFGDDIINFYNSEYITKKVLSLKTEGKSTYMCNKKYKWFNGFYIQIETDTHIFIQQIYYDEGLFQPAFGTSVWSKNDNKKVKFKQDVEFKVKNLSKQKLAFSKALSTRLGSNSPASILSLNTFKKIMENNIGGNGNKEYIKLQSG